MTALQLIDDIGALLARLFVATLGTCIALWGCYDLFVADRRAAAPPSVGHYILVGVVVVIGLGLAGGKHTMTVIAGITAWTRAWRGGAPDPPAPPPVMLP